MAEALHLLPWDFSDVDLSQEVMTSARVLCNENIENRTTGLETFMDLILEEKSFQPFLDINFLMRFLRGAKYNCEKAYSRLKRYYSFRKKYPNICEFYLPSTTLEAQFLNHIFALPYRAMDNSLVLIHKLGKFDPSIATFEQLVRLDLLVVESMLQNPVTQLCGITVLLDFTERSLMHLAELSSSRIQIFFDLFHSACTLQIKNVHLINAHGLEITLFNLWSPNMCESMKETFFNHYNDDWTVLHTYISAKTLPEEYGGQLPSDELVDIRSLVNHNEDYFISQLGCGFTEQS